MSHHKTYKLGEDELYPKRLASIPDAPGALHVRGHLKEHRLTVAMVGSRAASRPGMEFAETLAGEVARRGGCVISGGALGIDGAAHRGALAADGHTLVVFGCGLGHAYPSRHRALFEKITHDGALVSEYDHDVEPKPWQFIQRNRLIAALADVTVVVEASLRSGALHTAKFAYRYGRRVFARPGSRGSDALIAQGADSISSAIEFFDALEFKAPPKVAEAIALSGDKARLLRSLDRKHAAGPLALAHDAGIEANLVLSMLAEFELDGLVLALPGQNYIRSVKAERVLLAGAS